ncbi:(Na+)-NQR maturation NqrM [Spongiibacter nanhainus]|uniref:(Na+)-NQR maturation NqrM n=1 Tax=Spongiibacter nanhainus TaxID=2794344 RepID=A0A7T4QXY9_9GAMM|nr:(Na+)-NQR maturation NqrM [Spongiibacter nanhainus]QQD16722.1 (Na+)-NQR maturation NqrM [Spongiibacter nanhainus]
MLATIIATAIFMGLVIAAMSIGVIFGRKPIAGSCGGVGNALNDPDYVCDICGNDPNKCEEQSGDVDAAKQKASFYDAGR